MYTLEQLIEIYNSGQRVSPKTSLSNYLKEQTLFLIEPAFPRQRLFHLINQTEKIPTCKVCDVPVKWDDAQPTLKQKYREFCSQYCSTQDKDLKKRKLETELQRYGVGRKSIVKKTNETNIERYGAAFAIQTQEYKQKQKTTNLERYGVENVIQVAAVKARRVKTNIEKFGTKTPAESEEIKNKIKNICTKDDGLYESQRHIPTEVFALLQDKDWLYQKHIVEKKKVFEISESLGVHFKTVVRHLQKFFIEVKYYSFSMLENEIYEFMKNNVDLEIIRRNYNVISPQELDIFIPKLNLAVEVHGIYWHSELSGKDRHYHLNKYTQCNANGIHLIQIWQNEWILKQDIIKSKLLYLLNKNNKIYARKCVIEEISSEKIKEFLDKNHLQGYVRSTVNLGLFYKNELVSVMSFAQSRYDKKCEYEMTRFCNLYNNSVVGASSKLHSYFIKKYKPRSIISYCDLRYGTGNMYKILGYTHTHNSDPNYFYFKKGKDLNLESRIKFQKHKLFKLLPIFDPELTEWENMQLNGYNRIWDCGNAVYVWKN